MDLGDRKESVSSTLDVVLMPGLLFALWMSRGLGAERVCDGMDGSDGEAVEVRV